ncbi:MAG: hypothetical protein HKN92_11715 [Chitinophagales bacterium]|nr:hypothetical protein [Chitinophagales bacterium]
MKDYIDNQLVKLLYNETSVSKELALKQQMSDNADLYRSYREMRRIKDRLDHSLSKPSHSSVQYILDYSRKQQRQASI